MEIKKNDYFYLLMAVAICAIGVIAVGNQNTRLGLYGLVGLFGIALVMTIIIKPSVGAFILIIAIFTNISDNLTNLGYPGVIKPLVAVVAFAILVYYISAQQLPASSDKTRHIETFLFLYLMAVAASFLVAANKDRAIETIFDLLKDIAIIYCILFALRQFQEWKWAVWVVILTTTFLCLLGIYQLVTGNYTQTFFGLAAVQMQSVFDSGNIPRFSGPINAPNLWGQVLVSVVPLVVYRIIQEKRTLTKFLAIGILGVLLPLIFNTYSRGAYLGLGVVAVLTVLEQRLNSMVIAGGLILASILVFFLPSSYMERFQSLTLLSPTSENGIYQDSSLRGRSSEMLTGLSMFAAHPLLGVGAGNYRNNYQQYAQLIGLEYRAEEREPHSLYVELLSETGILGTIAFMGLLYCLFRELSKSIRALGHLPYGQSLLPWIVAIRLSIIAYLVTSLFLHGAYIRYFWILVALAISIIRLTDEQIKRYPYSSSPRL